MRWGGQIMAGSKQFNRAEWDKFVKWSDAEIVRQQRLKWGSSFEESIERIKTRSEIMDLAIAGDPKAKIRLGELREQAGDRLKLIQEEQKSFRKQRLKSRLLMPFTSGFGTPPREPSKFEYADYGIYALSHPPGVTAKEEPQQPARRTYLDFIGGFPLSIDAEEITSGECVQGLVGWQSLPPVINYRSNKVMSSSLLLGWSCTIPEDGHYKFIPLFDKIWASFDYYLDGTGLWAEDAVLSVNYYCSASLSDDRIMALALPLVHESQLTSWSTSDSISAWLPIVGETCFSANAGELIQIQIRLEIYSWADTGLVMTTLNIFGWPCNLDIDLDKAFAIED